MAVGFICINHIANHDDYSINYVQYPACTLRVVFFIAYAHTGPPLATKFLLDTCDITLCVKFISQYVERMNTSEFFHKILG